MTQARVPKFMDISLDKIYSESLSLYLDLIDYFPHYDDNYVPQRDFFWNILQSLKPAYYKKLIDGCHEKRCGVGED